MLEYSNLDSASINLSKLLIHEGRSRKTRGMECVEIPHPLLIKINNPCDRHVNILGRKASKTLPFGEVLALLSGVNDMRLYSDYVPEMLQYSDDGKFQRAGYGPRIRGFLGLSGNYESKSPFVTEKPHNKIHLSDQFEYVVRTLERDINSRQAVISITDPGNDQFDSEGELVKTKDIPCCRLLQFMVVDGRLDCTAYFRSNDLLFGFQQVNVFNNTFIQECISMILGIPVGKYYHFVNNLHYYTDKQDVINLVASKSEQEYLPKFDWEGYDERFPMEEFDQYLMELFQYRENLSKRKVKELRIFNESNFFSDWAKVFYRFHSGDKSINFINPYINKLFGRPSFKPGAEYVKVNIDSSYVFYEVHKPKAYLRKCAEDGKVAQYVGRADKYGYLNN